ncbi:MAG: hypothetical protein ACYDAC_11635 [Candidatus Dormibacteria bacterium]
MSRAGVFAPALSSPSPLEALCTAAALQVRSGRQRAAVIGDLHDLAVALAVEGREQFAPAILDVIDRLGGWCAPELRI